MTKIEWADETYNPITVATGGHWCRKISEGCANCYAEALNSPSGRFKDQFASGLTYTSKPPDLKLDYQMLASWAKKRTSKRIFVCSMTDWCGEWIHRDWQLSIVDAMIAAPKQMFMLLTKRANVLEDLVTQNFDSLNTKNIWFGVSVENQKAANTRLRYLAEMHICGFNTFVSFEPLLEHVELGDASNDFGWAIVGAESGKGARPIDEDWVRSLRDQIKPHGIPFFYKQNVVNGKKISLPKLDGKVWAEFPG